MPLQRLQVKCPGGIAENRAGGAPDLSRSGPPSGLSALASRTAGFGIEVPGYNALPVTTRWLAALPPTILLLVASPVSPARGESTLSLSPPESFGEIAADTYDEDGRRVGSANLRIQRLSSGNVMMEVQTGIDGSARSAASAELAPNGPDGTLRLVRERTQAVDETDTPMGVTTIDHTAGVAQCGKPEGSDDEPVRVELPTEDRVVNVPLNLLFQPLVRGETEIVDFQVLLCRARGARIVSAQAKVADTSSEDGDRLVEIRYSLDFGPILSRLAAPFMPQLSFWFEGNSPGAWVGHRMPLFSKGPTVFVVRSGFSPNLLGARP